MPLALSILKGQGGDIDVDFGGKGEGTIFILKFLSELFLSDKIVTIIIYFVTEQSFCIARMVFEKGEMQWLF